MKLVQTIASAEDEEWTSDALGLLMFVHLAIADDADRGLAATGLNRTHHRILFLVAHRPGVTVGEIVALLRLSAQAIQAPLRTLIDDQLIEQQSSERDRRKRHLIITDRGLRFLNELSNAQFARLANARRRAGDESFEGFLRVMRMMTADSDRDWLYPAEAALTAPRLRTTPPTPKRPGGRRAAALAEGFDADE